MAESEVAKAQVTESEGCCIVSLDLDGKDQTCFLCARVRDVWFYVEVWAKDIKSKKLRDRYIGLAKGTLQQRRKAEEETEQVVGEVQEDQGEGENDGGSKSPSSFGSSCASAIEQKNDSIDGKEFGEVENTSSPQTTNDDSGYASEARSDDPPKNDEPSLDHAENDLRSLLLPALEPVFSEHAPAKVASEPAPTLAAWYNAPIHCFSLRCPKPTSTSFVPVPRSDLDGPAYISRSLIPTMPLPKCLRSLTNIPFYSPSDVTVFKTSHDIHAPLHPTQVQPKDSDETLFLKLANDDDASSVERELRILHHLAKHDLHKAGIRAPSLAGLVGVPSTSSPSTSKETDATHPVSRARIMGFLLTMVPQPARPLTHYMTLSIPAKKRERWAKEAKGMVTVLHEHGIIWGDAKGDNFLVAGCEAEPAELDEGAASSRDAEVQGMEPESDEDDGNGEVYIIDFGGGLTAGWVDEEVANTMAGDDMGTGRLVNGLVDPVNNVVGSEPGPEEKVVESEAPSSKARQCRGRGRSEEDDAGEEEEGRGRKRRLRSRT